MEKGFHIIIGLVNVSIIISILNWREIVVVGMVNDIYVNT